MSIAVGNGSGNPGGSNISIVATPTQGAVGDLVMVTFGWATGAQSLSTVTDSVGNTWNAVPHTGATQGGGYGFTIVTNAWSGGTNPVTGTLTGGTPGGRVWCSALIPAANSPVVDQHIEGAVASSTAPSITTPGPLAQAQETLLLSSIGRQTGATVPTWVSPFHPASGVTVLSSAVGSGTTTAGAAILTFDNSVGTSPVTMGFTDGGGAANFGLGLLALKVSSGSIILSAPAAAVAAAGMLGNPSERASAILATVSAAGGAPLARMIASAPVATVAAVGFPGSIPSGKEVFRSRWFRPSVENLSTKVEGWWRF